MTAGIERVLQNDLPHSMPGTFLLQSSTLYSFLFDNMLKRLLLIERKWVSQTMHPKERETIAIKPHYRGCVSRLRRTDPHQCDPANDAQDHYRP